VDHSDHVRLLRDGVEARGGRWADLGAGRGAFTLALAELLGPGAEVHAVDRDIAALRQNEREMSRRFPETRTLFHGADFTSELGLGELDGVVMANSLHFQRDQPAVVRHVRALLRPGGRLLLVEYNTERANFAVPHPVPFQRWERLASEAGFSQTRLLVRRPSRFLGEIYSAMGC